jgi:hypothetical protein
VVVGIDVHRERVREPRHRMRRLQHLADVERMMIRIVVVQAIRGGEERFAQHRVVGEVLYFGKMVEARVETSHGLTENRELVGLG